jgi:hypothetical protein
MKTRKQPITAPKKFSETTTTKEWQECNKEEGIRRAAKRVRAHKERRTEQSTSRSPLAGCCHKTRKENSNNENKKSDTFQLPSEHYKHLT